MPSALGDYFRKVRLQKGLRPVDLARRFYRNVNKGCRRLQVFEATGQITPDLLTKVADALQIDNKVIEECLDQDRRQYQHWLSEPVKPYVILRLIAAVYSRLDLPEGIESQQEAEEFASGLARKHRLRTCLVWSRRLNIYFKADGILEGIMEAAHAPAMRIGGKDCLLKIDDGKIGVVPLRKKEQGYHLRQ